MPIYPCYIPPKHIKESVPSFWSYLRPNLSSCDYSETPPSIIWGSKVPLPPIQDTTRNYPFKPLVAFGLFWLEILRRILIPSSALVVHAQNKEEEPPPQNEESGKKVVARDLPLYVEEPECLKCKPSGKEEEKKSEGREELKEKRSLLLDTVKYAREELWIAMDQMKVIKKHASELFIGARDHTKDAVEYLREDVNLAPRVGAIAVGGLAGYIMALRKGRFKRLMYTGTGAGLMAALCYPREANEYSQEAYQFLKKYVVISYHFLNGVTRDLTGYQLPALPSLHPHLVISEGHHHHHHRDPPDTVPSAEQLLPPTASATHIHIHPEEEAP